MTDEEKRRKGLQKGYYNEATELMADEQSAGYPQPVEEGGDTVAADGTRGGGEAESTGATGATGAAGGGGFSGSTNGELLEYLRQQMEASKPESKEERERRERLERTQNLAYGIADLGRALGNMYHTTQYAPNGYDAKSSMSEKQRERMERAEKARKARRDEWLNYALTRKKIEEGERSFSLQQEKDKAAAKRAEEDAAEKTRQFDEMMKWRKDEQKRKDAELELKNAMFDWRQKFESGKLDVAKLNAQIRQIAEQYKQNRSDINHNLSSWKRTKSYIFDEHGKKIGEVEERIVINPNTGEVELQENNVTYNSGGGQAQGGNGGGTKKQNPMGDGKKKNPMN